MKKTPHPPQRPSRVIIDRILPEIDAGRFAAKRYIDQDVLITANILVDGHDRVKARLLYRHANDAADQVTHVEMADNKNDEWVASFQPQKLGLYYVCVEAGIDRYATWRSDISKKLLAQQDVRIDLLTGVQLFKTFKMSLAKNDDKGAVTSLEKKIAQLQAFAKDEKLEWPDLEKVLNDAAFEKSVAALYDESSRVLYPREVPIRIEPKISRFSSWYEFFPRSTLQPASEHGTFKQAEERLAYVKKMGFNIVYFPPIHPIGTAYRKGKNNSLQTVIGDVGSPWAIGAKEGGHKDILPALGTLADFKNLVKKARSLEIEVALDIAFQCSPDHPYVKSHPDWFKQRPDGTIQYAENPPKKYQDIYPFDFETADWQNLWDELLSVLRYWVDQGVRVFRVDNPHTKSLHFWEWAIGSIRAQNPEVIFLAEAFTRPKIMAYLAKAGFSQSYTYFTWRSLKWELTQYIQELTQTELIEYFGANFWPNTPDILPEHLQKPDRAIYMQRLILAATLSSNYGIYGPTFELMEYRPVRHGNEEYLDSEKYQLRRWDLNQSESLAPFIQRMNEIRKQFKSLQQNRTLKLHPVTNENLIAYSKTDGPEKLLIVVNLTPDQVQSGQVEVPLLDWEMDPQAVYEVHDLLTDARYFWTGWHNFVQLSPLAPAHIFHVINKSPTTPQSPQNQG